MTTEGKVLSFWTGPVDVGWCDFTVSIANRSWSCHASYIDTHPLRELIFAAVDLYDHIFSDPVPAKNAVWYATAADEPGGIMVRVVPREQNVSLSVFRFVDEFLLCGMNPADVKNREPDGQIVISFWEFADAVLEDAARTIARHGISGFREAWEPHRWDIDAHWETLPIEHFLFLAGLVRTRRPVYGQSLGEDLRLLEWVHETYGAPTERPDSP